MGAAGRGYSIRVGVGVGKVGADRHTARGVWKGSVASGSEQENKRCRRQAAGKPDE